MRCVFRLVYRLGASVVPTMAQQRKLGKGPAEHFTWYRIRMEGC